MMTIDPDHRVNETIGARIRLRRTRLKLTQSDLATLLGVSYQQVQKYESGTSRISASLLYQAARALRAPVGYFFGETDEYPQSSPKPLEPSLTEARLLGRLRAIDDPGLRENIIGLVQTIANTFEGEA